MYQIWKCTKCQSITGCIVFNIERHCKNCKNCTLDFDYIELAFGTICEKCGGTHEKEEKGNIPY